MKYANGGPIKSGPFIVGEICDCRFGQGAGGDLGGHQGLQSLLDRINRGRPERLGADEDLGAHQCLLSLSGRSNPHDLGRLGDLDEQGEHHRLISLLTRKGR